MSQSGSLSVGLVAVSVSFFSVDLLSVSLPVSRTVQSVGWSVSQSVRLGVVSILTGRTGVKGSPMLSV